MIDYIMINNWWSLITNWWGGVVIPLLHSFRRMAFFQFCTSSLTCGRTRHVLFLLAVVPVRLRDSVPLTIWSFDQINTELYWISINMYFD